MNYIRPLTIYRITKSIRAVPRIVQRISRLTIFPPPNLVFLPIAALNRFWTRLHQWLMGCSCKIHNPNRILHPITI